MGRWWGRALLNHTLRNTALSALQHALLAPPLVRARLDVGFGPGTPGYISQPPTPISPHPKIRILKMGSPGRGACGPLRARIMCKAPQNTSTGAKTTTTLCGWGR